MGKMGERIVQIRSGKISAKQVQRKTQSLCALVIGASINMIYIWVIY
jgi:hypothetical protein